MSTASAYASLPSIDAFLDRSDVPAWDAFAELPHGLRAARLRDCVVLLRHADGKALLSNRNIRQGLLDEVLQPGIDPRYVARRQQSLLQHDGEQHVRERHYGALALSHATVERLRPVMRRTINRLLDDITPGSVCDAVARIANPYPVPIICAALGVPVGDHALLTDAIDVASSAMFNPAISHDGTQGHDRLDTYVERFVTDRSHERGDNLLSRLHAMQTELTDHEITILVSTLIGAGTHTPRLQAAIALEFLARNPKTWEMLRNDPDTIAGTVEEIMRLRPVVSMLRRNVIQDIDLGGLTLVAGTRLLVAIGTMNRDPDVYPEPDSFDSARDKATAHLGLGAGSHYCLGAQLGRAELHEMLSVLTTRMKTVTVAGDVEWRAPTGFQGPTRLPLAFTAA